jgi:hypothetical protein
MIKKSLNLILIVIIFIAFGCGAPECTVIIYDSTKDELLKELAEYSLSEDIVQHIITRESFNNLMVQEANEIILSVREGDEVLCDSVWLTEDSLICSSKGEKILFSINEINQVEVYYIDRTWSLFRNSVILGSLTSSIALLGYLPPNPPQPDWKAFVAFFGAGFIAGIILDVSTSRYYCLISKNTFFRIYTEKQNGI